MRSATALPDAPSPALFGREERLGLGIAIAAHVILVVGLVAWDSTPKPVDVPQRISVTVSDEVALESISPNPMADPAPSVGAELGEPTPPAETFTTPEPVARTVPDVTPRPAPTPRPSAAPKPEPRRAEAKPTPPTPKPATREPAPSRGSRVGSDFLSGTGGTGSDREQPAERQGAATAASLSSAITRQLRPHWTAPQGVDADKLVTVLAWQMNRDGSLRGRPTVVSQTGITDSNRAQADRHAELAIRAVQLAAPFDLPSEYYDSWSRVDAFRFDRRL